MGLGDSPYLGHMDSRSGPWRNGRVGLGCAARQGRRCGWAAGGEVMTRVSRWLHKSIMIAWVINVLGIVGLCYWGLDRTAPFRVIEQPRDLRGRAGDTIKADIVVHRVLRGCDVSFTRYVFDSRGVRFDQQGVNHMSAETIEQMDMDAPGHLIVAFEVPHNAAPGRAYLVTSLAYVCNPVHYLFPIQVSTRLPFTIDQDKP